MYVLNSIILYMFLYEITNLIQVCFHASDFWAISGTTFTRALTDKLYPTRLIEF